MRHSPLLSTLAVLLAFAAGCGGSSKSTSPRVPPSVSRLVTVVVTDSLGTPLWGGPLRATSLGDSAGLARVVTGYAFNDSGLVRYTLPSGPWAFTGRVLPPWPEHPGMARGGTAVVPGSERPGGDTVLVRIAVHTTSWVRGRVRLQGRDEHSGTLVSLGAAETCVLTGPDGAFVLDGVPPGHWAVTAWHGGFALGVWWVDVPAPGSTVALADDSLTADPDGPPDPPTHTSARPEGFVSTFRIPAPPK